MRSKQHTKGKKDFQQETDFRVLKCLDVYSRFLGFLSDFQVSGPMPASDSKWTNALSESSHLIPDGNTRKGLWPALLLGEKLFLAQWCGWQARVFFFLSLCDGCSVRLLKTRTAFLCMGEKVGVGQDPASQCLVLFCFFSYNVPSKRVHLGSNQHMEYNGIQWRGPGASSAFVKINGGKKAGHLCSWTALRQ